jgi:hypothetical protein
MKRSGIYLLVSSLALAVLLLQARHSHPARD